MTRRSSHERSRRRAHANAFSSLLVAVILVLVVAESCSSNDSSTASYQARVTLQGSKRGAQIPAQAVEHNGTRPSDFAARSFVGVKRLKHFDNKRCGEIGAIDVYEVTGHGDGLWQRMLQ